MMGAKQYSPTKLTFLTSSTRLLRARLIYEEAMETVAALGCVVHTDLEDGTSTVHLDSGPYEDSPAKFCEIVDGCCDISVVTIGTLSAMGVPDEPVLRLVDENNLSKFGPGHSYREDGKLIKPADFVPVNFYPLLFGSPA